MGYIFVSLAIFAGLAKGFCGKKISGLVNTLKGTFYMNMLRMFLCVVIGLVISLAGGNSAFAVDWTTLLISAVSGLGTAMFVVSWVISVRKGAYVMLDVFLMLGSGLVIVLCKVFFNENASITQLIGFALLVVASYFLCSYSSKIKGKFTVSSFLMLVACGAFSGLADFSQKWFVHALPMGDAAVFNLYTYLFAGLVLLLSYVVIGFKEKAQNDGKTLKVFLVICIMAICLFANSYFKTIAAKHIASAILYPLCSGVAIVLSAVMASVFFKEKITVRCVIGIAIAVVAIVVMNL